VLRSSLLGVPFTLSLRVATLQHGKPASAGISREGCPANKHDIKDTRHFNTLHQPCLV